MNILEELWYGKISPYEQSYCNSSEYTNQMNILTAQKEHLQTLLPLELQQKMDELTDLQQQLSFIAEREAFAAGFRLAVQLMMDSLSTPSASP